MIRDISVLFQLISLIGEKLKLNKITRYVTWTKDRYLFKNKGNFVYNSKLRDRNSGRLSAKADSIPEKADRSHIRFREKSRFDFTAKCEIFCKYYT